MIHIFNIAEHLIFDPVGLYFSRLYQRYGFILSDKNRYFIELCYIRITFCSFECALSVCLNFTSTISSGDRHNVPLLPADILGNHNSSPIKADLLLKLHVCLGESHLRGLVHFIDSASKVE